MKKIITAAIAITLAATLAACGDGGSSSSGSSQNYQTTTTAATTPAKQTVDKLTYVIDGDAGTYSGEVDSNNYPDGEGTWTWDNGAAGEIIQGRWVNGVFTTGTVEVIYRNASMGKITYVDGVPDEEDAERVYQNWQKADEQAEFEADMEALEGIIGFIGYLDENIN